MLLLFFHATESILTIVAMFMIGYFMTRAGWINDSTGNTFAKIILNVSLPCYMLFNLMSNFDRTKLVTLSSGLIVPIVSMGISYFAAIFVSNAAKIDIKHRGVFRSIFFCSNTIFIGLPVNLALFGEKSVPYVLLYYIVNTSFFWTLGAYQIGIDGKKEFKSKIFSAATLKRIVPPALMGFIIAVILILVNIKLPTFVMDTCKYIGELTTPLAMLFIGIVLYSVKLRDVHFNKEIWLLIFGRFVFCPLLVVALVHIFHVPAMMGKVFVIQSAMPAMTSTGVVAKGCGADYEFGTIATVITTIISMIVIPIYMVAI